MQWSNCLFFGIFFLYCKINISFLELFSATCFLDILQTQLTRTNTLIFKKPKKRQHLTFMVMSSNDDNSDIFQFFIKTHSILSIQYMYKISCKMDKKFLRYSMFSSLLAYQPSLSSEIFKPSPGSVEEITHAYLL